MKITRWMLYLLLTAIVSGVTTSDATALARPVVVAVSDSLTNEEPTNWLAMLGVMRPDIRVVAEAHGGWTTKSYFKAKFDGVAWASLPERADVAIILLGSNNLFEDRGGSDASVQEAVDGVQKIEAYLRAKYPHVRVILAAPPTCVPERWTDRTGDRRIDEHSPKYLGKLSDAYRQLAARRGWEFVDLYPLLESPGDFVDAAHATEQANRKIAAAIGQAVNTLLPRWVTHPFNGKNLHGWEARIRRDHENHWRVGRAEVDPENPRRLVVREGGSDLVNLVTGHSQGADLSTQARYGDCRIEIEVMVPERSNSGIYVMGRHEIQVLDALNSTTAPKSNMGAIYGIRGPTFFPAEWLTCDWRDPKWKAWSKTAAYQECVSKVVKPPGEWQKFVIEFRTEKQDPDTKQITRARFLRVELNDVVIHENVELERGARSPGPLLLQGNHGPVAYRNIKITPLDGETRDADP
jgi:lysophospholipase L1-like esterase